MTIYNQLNIVKKDREAALTLLKKIKDTESLIKELKINERKTMVNSIVNGVELNRELSKLTTALVIRELTGKMTNYTEQYVRMRNNQALMDVVIDNDEKTARHIWEIA